MAMEQWEIDAGHSSIEFSVRHLMIAKVRGRFTRWKGVIQMDSRNFEHSSVEVHIEASSIETGLAPRDADLRSKNFLFAERFPQLVFKSKRVEKQDEKRFRLVGELTIRGNTREIVLDTQFGGRVKDPYGNERVAFTATTSLDRKDYGLTWNQTLETGGVVVGDRVDIEIEIQAIKQVVKYAA